MNCILCGSGFKVKENNSLKQAGVGEFSAKAATKKRRRLPISASGDPPGDRTLDPNIKSVVLYQLS